MRIKFFFLYFLLTLIIGCSSSQITPPVLISEFQPTYPLEAELKDIEGETTLSLMIDENGDVEKVVIRKSSGSEILDNSALDYAKDLVFSPAIQNEKPVVVWVSWTIDYRLSRFYNMNKPKSLYKVLVFTKTEGFEHESTREGVQALVELAEENHFDLNATSNSSMFRDDVLKNYQVVIFLNTSGDVLTKFEQNAFKNFINNGGGFVGVHGAVDTEYNWPWYGKLIGAYFDDHPAVQTATINVIDRTHISTNMLPDKWTRTDEWYNLRNELPADIHVLALLDESTYDGGKMGSVHPYSWYHEYDGGRAWITLGGHTKESYSEELFLEHLLGGVKYAAGVE